MNVFMFYVKFLCFWDIQTYILYLNYKNCHIVISQVKSHKNLPFSSQLSFLHCQKLPDIYPSCRKLCSVVTNRQNRLKVEMSRELNNRVKETSLNCRSVSVELVSREDKVWQHTYAPRLDECFHIVGSETASWNNVRVGSRACRRRCVIGLSYFYYRYGHICRHFSFTFFRQFHLRCTTLLSRALPSLKLSSQLVIKSKLVVLFEVRDDLVGI